MKKRKRMNRNASSKTFRRGTRINKRNVSANPMRGGWRL